MLDHTERKPQRIVAHFKDALALVHYLYIFKETLALPPLGVLKDGGSHDGQ